MTPPGKCQCGCGRSTEISDRDRPDRGIVKGQFNMFVRGHSSSKRGSPVAKKGWKWCVICKKQKPLSEFHKNKSSASGVCSYCKSCGNWYSALWRDKNPERSRKNRDRHVLASRYGLNQVDYDALEAGQLGLCAICRRPCVGKRRLDVDHDHTTGKVRGLLCRSCNFVLGYAHDDIGVLERAVEYMRRFSDKQLPARLVLVGDNDHEPDKSGVVLA